MLRQSDELIIRERLAHDGSMRYLVDQLENKDSIVLWPGGTYGDEYIYAATNNITIKKKQV